MLHRQDPAGLIVIAQPAHAWLSGQLARAWGNDQLGTIAPREEVCLAADQHDNGWTAWESAPTLNSRTGRPHTFMEMPTAVHVGIWSSSGPRALTQGRYAALLVALHGAALYERHDYARDTPEEARLARDLVAQTRSFTDALLASLRDDPFYAPFATPEVVARNRRLIATWDRLSLLLCHGLRLDRSIDAVPAASGDVSLTITPMAADSDVVTVEPWPFRQPELTLVCDGRRFPETFDDEDAMRAALSQAPWVRLEMHLRPV